MNMYLPSHAPGRRMRILGWVAAPLLWMLLHASPASAVPAFARQTHMPCAACHVGAFGPELTPFGREFKLDGYTLSVGNDTKIPLSAMLVESFTHTKKAQAAAPASNFGTNNNTELEQASIFIAGRISEHMGVFAQYTYSQNGGLFGWDNTDIRYARKFNTGNHSGVWGISVNNNPTVSDVFHSAPAWIFPYMASDLAPGAPAAPIIEGGLGQAVIGASAYTMLDGHLYLEAGGYKSLSVAFLNDVNAGYAGKLSGAAPYARAAYTWNIPKGEFTLGGFLFNPKLSGVGTDARGNPYPLSGPTDNYNDLGLSADYMYSQGDHIITANALYVHEKQTLNNTFASGGSSNLRNTLDSFNLKGSYWYQNTYGLTLASFAYNGSSDMLLYGGKPNTQGGILELDYNPFGKANSWMEPYMNMRVGLQYTWYSKFSGVNGFFNPPAKASDANTTYLYVWFAL